MYELPRQAHPIFALPATACSFGGCARPFHRWVGPWRLCELHARGVERGSSMKRMIGRLV